MKVTVLVGNDPFFLAPLIHRSHCRREDCDKQSSSGVSKPQTDRRGSRHRGVHHPLHLQHETGNTSAVTH